LWGNACHAAPQAGCVVRAAAIHGRALKKVREDHARMKDTPGMSALLGVGDLAVGHEQILARWPKS
jgi:hypothetical protein